jgi:hypothetical protein
MVAGLTDKHLLSVASVILICSPEFGRTAERERPMTHPNTPAAGWYPDPAGQPGQRYHDGSRWTTHFVPTPPSTPVPAPTPAIAVAVSNGGGTSHGLHLVLTLLTCGLWLPIWVLAAIFGGSSSSVAIAGNGAIVQSRNRPMLGAAVLGALLVMGVVAQHPWLLIIFAVVGILAGGGVWLLKSAQQRDEQVRREQFERDMIANRAVYEDTLYQQGDPRGTHGRYMPPESP